MDREKNYIDMDLPKPMDSIESLKNENLNLARQILPQRHGTSHLLPEKNKE